MKNKRINIKVSESDHRAIADRAAKLHLTISEYLRRLVVADIAKSEK